MQRWRITVVCNAAAPQINDRYEFSDELDLDAGGGAFLAADADRGVRNQYRLHSVLVHSGGVHGGHYYAFIRPDGRQWLKFDDDKVLGPRRPPAVRGRCRAGALGCRKPRARGAGRLRPWGSRDAARLRAGPGHARVDWTM